MAIGVLTGDLRLLTAVGHRNLSQEQYFINTKLLNLAYYYAPKVRQGQQRTTCFPYDSIMSLVSFSRGRPQCLSCMRRTLNGFNDAWVSSTRPQIRGKKKLAKSTTIKVRLLADIPRYGRKGISSRHPYIYCEIEHNAKTLVGSIIPISPGRMRNDFYPREKAEYMTTAQLREAGLRDVDMERDSTFGTSQRRVNAQESKAIHSSIAIPTAVPTAVPVAVEVDLIKV
jgi:hypothetical protein